LGNLTTLRQYCGLELNPLVERVSFKGYDDTGMNSSAAIDFADIS
jgi:hypothetical protein